MALLVMSVAWSAYSVAVGVSSLASSFTVSMSSALVVFSGSTDKPHLSVVQADRALAAMGGT
eukprot:1666081-Rhodomonas_salina.1